MLRFKKFLEDKGLQAPAKDVMTVGKHAGKTFNEIMTDYPSYCEHVMRLSAEEGSKNFAMLRLAKYLENQGFPPPEDVVTLCDPADLLHTTKTSESQTYEKITKKMQDPPPRMRP